MKLLLPFSWLYAFAMQLRNRLFDWEVLKSESAGVPVISVGNLTVGGTGKTPLVEYIAKLLLEKGRKVAVVSRGYKRKSSGVVVVSDGTSVLANAEQGGDEPVQVAMKFPEVIVVVGEKRVEAAKQAVQLGAEVIVLDDGFQHRYLKRELDIVVVDSTCDLTKDSVLPAGRLRESLSGLRRANLVAFSKSDDTLRSTTEGKQAQFDLDVELRRYFSGPFIKYSYRTQEVRRADDGAAVSPDSVRTMNLLAFSGIGNHEAFMQELKKTRFGSLRDMRFSDHHEYSEGDAATIASTAKKMKADACITTEKDMVRLRSRSELLRKFCSEIPVFYLKIEVEILGGKEILYALIENSLRGDIAHDHWNY